MVARLPVMNSAVNKPELVYWSQNSWDSSFKGHWVGEGRRDRSLVPAIDIAMAEGLLVVSPHICSRSGKADRAWGSGWRRLLVFTHRAIMLQIWLLCSPTTPPPPPHTLPPPPHPPPRPPARPRSTTPTLMRDAIQIDGISPKFSRIKRWSFGGK